jgi:hypothetical protein
MKMTPCGSTIWVTANPEPWLFSFVVNDGVYEKSDLFIWLFLDWKLDLGAVTAADVEARRLPLDDS